MTSNKYNRDMNDVSQQQRPGRFDPRILQYTQNAGDGIPGIQWMIHKILGMLLLPRFVIEGCSHSGGTLNNGYIMWNGKVVKVEQQSISLSNDEWLYIDSSGIGHATGIESTAKAGVLIAQDISGTPYDIRFRQTNNILNIYGLNIQANVDILGDLDVDGTTNLDNTDVDGTLDVSGAVDFHENLDMNSKKITGLVAGTTSGDSMRYDEFNSHTTNTSNPHQVSLEQARNKSNVLAGTVDMNSAGKIINLSAPSNDNDSARKTEVDTVQSNLTSHEGSTGASHTYINQNVTNTASPTFANVTIADDIIHSGNTNTLVSFTTDAISFETNGTARIDINNSGVRFGTGARVTEIENNDNLGTSDTKLCTQGNVKAYADATEASANSYTDSHASSSGSSHTYISQSVTSDASPTFAGLTINGNITVSGNVDGIDVSAVEKNVAPITMEPYNGFVSNTEGWFSVSTADTDAGISATFIVPLSGTYSVQLIFHADDAPITIHGLVYVGVQSTTYNQANGDTANISTITTNVKSDSIETSISATAGDVIRVYWRKNTNDGEHNLYVHGMRLYRTA